MKHTARCRFVITSWDEAPFSEGDGLPSCDSEAEAERTYGLLTGGGEIFMKMERTPFANRFAMLRDRFGTSWMLLHQPDQPR